MTIERGLRGAAGIVVLLSTALGVWVHSAWLLLTAFAGLNLLQSAFTNWCPMVWILARLGFEPCVANRAPHGTPHAPREETASRGA
jgi:hypothetical protein